MNGVLPINCCGSSDENVQYVCSWQLLPFRCSAYIIYKLWLPNIFSAFITSSGKLQMEIW